MKQNIKDKDKEKPKEFPTPDKPAEQPVIHHPELLPLPPDSPEIIPEEQPVTMPIPEIQQPG